MSATVKSAGGQTAKETRASRILALLAALEAMSAAAPSPATARR